MTLTYIPDERSLSFIFTTFADVARHGSCARWRPVNLRMRNVVLALAFILSLPLRRVVYHLLIVRSKVLLDLSRELTRNHANDFVIKFYLIL